MNWLVHVLTSLVLVGLVLYGFAVILGADAFKASVGRATLTAFGLLLLVPLVRSVVVTSVSDIDTNISFDVTAGIERLAEHPAVLLLGGLLLVGYGAFLVLLVTLRRRLRGGASTATRQSLRGRERVAAPASEEP